MVHCFLLLFDSLALSWSSDIIVVILQMSKLKEVSWLVQERAYNGQIKSESMLF